jgi:hypothetical protein
MKTLYSTGLSLLLLFSAVNAAYSQLDFLAGTVVPDERAPQTMETGDFDNNGLRDIAYLTADRTFRVLYLQPDKTFIKKSFYIGAGGLGVIAFNAGDFNEDGKTDIVIYDNNTAGANPLLLYLSEGTSFSRKVLGTHGFDLSKDIEVVKFNNDTHLDILCATDSGPFLLYEGTGTGEFVKKSFPASAASHTIATGDINNDGKADVMALSYGLEMIVYQSTTGTTFTETKVTLPYFPRDLVAADFSNDQIADIAIAYGSDPGTGYLLNDGTGNLTMSSLTGLPPLYTALEAADFNKDGKIDILGSGDLNFEPVVVLKNDGSNSFSSLSLNPKRDSYISRLQVDDLDADGKNEIITLSYSERLNISTYDNGFIDFNTSILGLMPTNARVANMDKDGFEDLVVVNFNYSISILYGDESSLYERRKTFIFEKELYGLAVADYNNDTYPDIAYTTNYAPGRDETGVILSNGTGGYGQPTSIIAHSSFVLETGDLNNDGKMDLLTNGFVLLGDGLGDFAEQVVDLPFTPFKAAIGKINGDDLNDILISNGQTDLHVGYNSGTGTFPNFTALPSTLSNLELSIADVNNDSKNDIIAGHGDQAKATLYVNGSDGSFTTSVVNFTQSDYGNSVAVDFNKDGKIDLLSTGYQNVPQPGSEFQDIDIYVQDGAGNFTYDKTFDLPNSISPSIIRTGDLNHDEKIDIAIFSSNGNSVATLLSDLVEEPVNTNPGFTVQSKTSISATVTIANAKKRVILIREANAVNTAAADGTFYTANLEFGLGTTINTDNYVVVSGTATSFELKGLKANTTYHLSSFDYNVNQKNTIINYSADATTFSFKTKNIQTINSQNEIVFNSTAPQTITVTATSGLPVALVKQSGNITVTGNSVLVNGPGPVVLKANQAGDADYDPAPEKTLEFCVNPPKPEIAIDIVEVPYKVTLTSSSATNNQWYYNGNPVAGATSSVFNPGKNGIFKVVVDFEGCKDSSEETDFLITGIEVESSALKTYPNPVHKELLLESPYPVDRIDVIDLTGRSAQVRFEEHDSHRYLVDLEDTAQGVHILSIKTSQGIFTKKVVKAR